MVIEHCGSYQSIGSEPYSIFQLIGIKHCGIYQVMVF